MANDADVLKETWNGKIPVLFRLCPSDVYLITEKPEPLYMAVMRETYFPLVFTEKIHKYYKRFIDPDFSETNVWLEDNNGIPIQWHWPIGVLFDLASLSKVEIPWVITVHYKDFPEKDLIRFSGKDSVESMYMSSLKEADFLKHRGQTINVMQKHEIKRLFQGLTEENFDKFWSLNNKFMDGGDTIENNTFKYIPIRLHIKQDTIRQCLLSPYNKDNKPNTLSDLFNYFLQQNSSKTSKIIKESSKKETADPPSSVSEDTNLNGMSNENDLLDPSETDNKASDSESNTDSTPINTEPTNETTATNINNNENSAPLMNINDQCKDRLSNIKYLTQGICPPLDTPLLWLSRHLSYPDNFLHICVLDLL